jgi:hypothetical protein
MLKLQWDNLNMDLKEQILSDACINSRFAYYEWCELDEWLKAILIDNINMRSKNTVSLVN